jgi:hypothetical protein
MNDLHTAALTAELAVASGAFALINSEHDRNDVDLNRICEAHERAPWFLECLAELVDAAVARHGRATLLTLHGWNVIQPVVDLGLGCAAGPGPFQVGRMAAVTPAFAAAALPRLVDACTARDIGATVGARYPARARENLIQLFTPRYRDDPRPLVRAIAAAAPRVDAVQLELGIALRWPGPWRTRLLDACRAALPALVAPPPAEAEPPAAAGREAEGLAACRLEFASPALSGLAGLDAGRGGRLLLFPPGGGLALFTGERIGLEPASVTGALALHPTSDGGLALRFRGPLLRFPDTTPFLDLEAGLARAELIEAAVALDFAPNHPMCGSAEFGAVSGTVTLDGTPRAVNARGFAEHAAGPGAWPRLRVAVALGEGTGLALTLGLESGETSGFLCRGGRHVAVTAARATLGAASAPLDHVSLELELADGERLSLTVRATHRLPVIRARGAAPVRIDFAACRLDGQAEGPAGWIEAGGL